ncbi:MAG: hypothetical protein GC166_14795 [Alphaproteobacteria bacterium]|nr:hypothetical protein [Alphaproteobacteria bacterium]
MKRSASKIAGLVAALATVSFASAAIAAPSCTSWMDQGDGTSWKQCVNDDGSQHCYRISNTPGSTAYEVSCSQ